MAYATVTELREYLPQVTAGDDIDDLLEEILERATAIIDGQLGFGFGDYAEEASARKIWARAGEWLHLPGYAAASITEITLDDEEIEDWEAAPDDFLWLYRSTDDGGWKEDVYEVTAKWGWGDPPATVVQVCLELAVNLWRGRDRGMYSDVIGVEGGGAVGYQRALTNQQRMILADVRAKYLGPVFA